MRSLLFTVFCTVVLAIGGATYFVLKPDLPRSGSKVVLRIEPFENAMERGQVARTPEPSPQLAGSKTEAPSDVAASSEARPADPFRATFNEPGAGKAVGSDMPPEGGPQEPGASGGAAGSPAAQTAPVVPSDFRKASIEDQAVASVAPPGEGAPVDAAAQAPAGVVGEPPVDAAAQAPAGAFREPPVDAAAQAPAGVVGEPPVDAAAQAAAGAFREPPVDAAAQAAAGAFREPPVDAAAQAPAGVVGEPPIDAAAQAPVEAAREKPLEAKAVKQDEERGLEKQASIQEQVPVQEFPGALPFKKGADMGAGEPGAGDMRPGDMRPGGAGPGASTAGGASEDGPKLVKAPQEAPERTIIEQADSNPAPIVANTAGEGVRPTGQVTEMDRLRPEPKKPPVMLRFSATNVASAARKAPSPDEVPVGVSDPPSE
jgi:hypothetical protein